MAVDASKVYRELDSGQRHIKDLSRDELLAVKNYVTFQGRKSETTTQPLQATKKGQEQLAKQVAPKPKAKKKVTTPKPSPTPSPTRTPSPAPAPTALRPEVEAALAPTQAQAPQRNLTWGEELNQYLTQKFPEAYPSAKRTVGLALEANPFLKTTLGAFGAPGTSAVDIAAEKISPTGTKTIGEKLSEQYGNFATGVSQNIQQQLGKGNTFPNVLEALSAGFGTMEQKARPALDVTRGIYEQSAIASRGLTPEQARAESAAWVARNPNAAGASANILGEALDPLNVPIGGAVAKVAKAAKAIKPKIAEVVTPKKAQPAPAGSLQQPIIDVGVRRPELPGQVQEKPAPVQKTPPKAIEAPKLPGVKSTKTLTKKEQQEVYGNLFGKTKTKKVQGKLTYVSPERAKAQQVYADMFDNPEKYTKPKQQPGQLALEAPKDAGVAKAQQRIAQFNEYLRKKYASVLAKGERPTHEQVLASWKTFTKGRGQGFVDTFKQAYPEPKAVEGAAKPLRQEAPKVNLGVKADTVVRKTDAGYEVIEAKTGRVLGTGTKQSDAVKAAKESIAKITKEVNATRKKIKANDTKIAEYEGYLQNELMSSSHAYLRKEVDRLKSENQTMQTALDKDASLLGKGQKPKPKPKQEPTPPKEEVEKAFKAVVEEQKPQPKPATEPKGKGKPKPEQKVAPQIAEDLAPKPPVKQQAQKPEAKNEREEFIETATARLEQDLKGGAKPSPKPKAVDETAKLAEYEKRKASGKPEDQLDPDEQKEYEALKAKVKKPATEDAMEVIRKSFDEDFEPTPAKDKPTVADNIAEDLGKKPEPKDPAKSPLVQKALQIFSKKIEDAKKRIKNMEYQDYANIQSQIVSEFFSKEKISKDLEKKYGEDYRDSDEYLDYLDEKGYFKSETDKLMPKRESLAQRREREKLEAEQKQKEEKQRKEEQSVRKQSETISSLTDKDIENLAKNVDQNADSRFVQELELRKKNKKKGETSEKVRKMDENLSTLKKFFMGDVEDLPLDKVVDTDDFKKHFESLGYPPELFGDFKEFFIKNEKLKREYIDVVELGAKDKKREREYYEKSDELAYAFQDKVEIFEAKKKGKPIPEVLFSERMRKQDLAQRINQKLQEENDKESLSKKMSQGFIPQLFRSKTSKRREGLKSKDQDVEAFSTATAHQGFVRGRVEALKKIGTDLKEGFKDIFRAYNGAPNDVREDLFEGERKLARSADEAEKTIKNMVAGLKSEYDMDLFQRILVLRDAKATLDASDVVDVPMPFGLKKDQIVPELRRLYAEMKGNKEVRSAIRKYDSVMKAIFEDLVDRGVLPKEARRTFYFPHKIMEYAHGISAGAGRKLDTPFRGYTLAREGSTKPYETDFVKVMRDVLTKVYSDNYISDTLNKVLDKADRLNEFSANDLVNLIGGKNVKSAQEANVPHITKSAWTSNRAQELMDEGMDDKSAMKQANAEWVPHEKSVKSKFFARKFAEFKEAGVEETEIAKMVTQAWNEYMKQPKITVQVLDGKTVIVKNGERFKFFSPKGSNKVYLVSEKMHNILNEFGTPLHENVYAQMFGDAVQFFKTSALTISAPARIVVDTISNARKLLQRDIGAFKYLPRAVRLMIRTSSVKDIRFLKQLAEAGLKGDVKKLDDKTLQFALNHEIIEPTESIRGVYAFTPRWKKFVRYVLDPRSYATYSKNITQRADEFFKLMKASADFDRIENGGYANSAGVIDLEGIDDKYVQASKIAHEFFVNPMRQSRGMRKIFTQGLMPFLNWAAVDTIHAFRYMKNNKMKSILWTGVFATSMAAWNNTGERRKIEEMLPPDRRQIPHLITGYKDDKGRPIIFYLPFAPGLTAMTGTGLAKIPQNIVDAGMESTIPGKEKRAWSDIYTPSEAISSVSKTAVGFMNPLAKVPIEQYYNESMYTGLPIVKRSEEGTGVELAKRLEYTLNQVLPPYRAFTGVQQEAAKLTEEEATEQEKKAPAWQNLQKSLAKTFDPLKRVVKAEDMTKLAEEGLKRLEKTRTIQKNNAYQAILDALPAALESDNYDSVFRIAQQIGLTERELKTYARLHEVEVLQKAMKITKDAKKRESYKKQIEALKEKSAVGTAKRAGQVNQEQAEYFLEMRKGGEK